jgi:hypothetical protein
MAGLFWAIGDGGPNMPGGATELGLGRPIG